MGKVTEMLYTFYGASKFVGTGLNLWDTASVTNLYGTFWEASEMNADLSGWKVAKVKTLYGTFYGASKFAGVGLNSWVTASATDLTGTFYKAGEMNSDLSKWNVANVNTLKEAFYGASKFAGVGLANWNVNGVNSMADTFTGATGVESCMKHRIALAWVDNSAFQATNYDTGWASEKCLPQTNAEFKLASWDWVQDATMATHKWGDIGDWDVSGVKDFRYAFSTHRNVDGAGSQDGNPKVVSFVGTGLSKWDTTSATSLYKTFYQAKAMNSDLSGWSVGTVTDMEHTFRGASKFVGTGLNLWDTASTVSMRYAYNAAREMNSDLSKWNVAKVKTLEFMFSSASKFVGTGLSEWDTTSVTNLNTIFYGAVSMNVNLGGWSVAKGE